MNTSGTDIPNHIHTKANIVVKGTAPDECSPQMKKFRKKPTPNTIPGYKVAVCKKKKKKKKKFHRTCNILNRKKRGGGGGGNKTNFIYQSGCLLPVVAFECSKEPCRMVTTCSPTNTCDK